MTDIVYAERTAEEKAARQLQRDLERFLRTKKCPDYLQTTAAAWIKARA